jgi:hypothetical protein
LFRTWHSDGIVYDQTKAAAAAEAAWHNVLQGSGVVTVEAEPTTDLADKNFQSIFEH